MHDEHHQTPILDAAAPVLSQEERTLMWQEIEARLAVAPVPTPYLFSFIPIRSMAPIAIVLLAVLGLGGTAAAAEQARPGDFLFPVDRAMENARLAITTNADTRATLKAKYADERISELRSILDESETPTIADNIDAASSTIRTLSVEADVFTDTTIVKVEINDRVTVFESTANTRDEIVDEIVARFSVDRAAVEAALDFEIEDRASRTEDRRSRVVASDEEVRLSAALRTVMEYLNDTDLRTEVRTELRTKLAADVDGIVLQSTDRRLHVKTTDGQIKIEEKGDRAKVEIRADGYRVKTETKNGQTEIKTKTDHDSRVNDDDDEEATDDERFDDRDRNDDDDDDDVMHQEERHRSNDSDDDSDDSFDRVRIEVRVEDGMAEVRAEYGGSKREFETRFTTEAALIAEIALRTGLSTASIESGLDLEIED